MIRFQWLHDLDEIFTFLPLEHSNEDNKTLQAQTWLVANYQTFITHQVTVLLNLKIVCHLNFIKNYSKAVNFCHLLATEKNYHYNSPSKSMKHYWAYNLPLTPTQVLSLNHPVAKLTITVMMTDHFEDHLGTTTVDDF